MLHKQPFPIKHELSSSPLFEIERLISVAQVASQRQGDVYYDAGNVGIDDKFGSIPVPDLPVEKVVERIKTAGAWVIVKHAESDPAYRDVLDEFSRFARDIAGPGTADEFLNPEMLIIITSPNRLTSFHFDAEINFLIQIHGKKQVWVCDPKDRSVVSEEDIENYYCVSTTSGTYKPGVEARARRFELHPGDGVHIPTHGAHWVKNDDNVSVSLSLNFEFPRSKYRDPYRANYHLRKLGLSPKPPGGSPAKDRAKAMTVAAARSVARYLKR